MLEKKEVCEVSWMKGMGEFKGKVFPLCIVYP